MRGCVHDRSANFLYVGQHCWWRLLYASLHSLFSSLDLSRINFIEGSPAISGSASTNVRTAEKEFTILPRRETRSRRVSRNL